MINLNYRDKLMKNRLLKIKDVFSSIYFIHMLITKLAGISCLFSPK